MASIQFQMNWEGNKQKALQLPASETWQHASRGFPMIPTSGLSRAPEPPPPSVHIYALGLQIHPFDFHSVHEIYTSKSIVMHEKYPLKTCQVHDDDHWYFLLRQHNLNNATHF